MELEGRISLSDARIDMGMLGNALVSELEFDCLIA